MNYQILVVFLLSIVYTSEQGCVFLWDNCKWASWKRWGDCSQTCGGGTRTRSRSVCCTASYSYDKCIDKCNLNINDGQGRRSCNEVCYNHGTYNYGRCICTGAFGGSCCTDPKCGYNNKWCWPGNCGTNKYVANCFCDDGFKRHGPSTMCELERQPTLQTCRVGLENRNGDAVNTTTTGPCSVVESVYTNLQPNRLSFTIESSFSINVTSDPSANKISSWRFGIVDNSVEIVKRDVRGNARRIRQDSFRSTPECNVAVSDRDPKQMTSCTGNLLPRQSLLNGERICLNFHAYAGGFLDPEGGSITTYKRTETSKELCFMYDDAAPTHCSGSTTCLSTMLALPNRITDNPNIAVTFSSWTDPVPLHGRSTTSSGIKHYVAGVLRVEELDKTTLVMKYPEVTTSTLSVGNTHVNVTLQTEPALYVILLEVHDVAGNVQMARRFVLYDNSSTVAIIGNNVLWSDTASKNTNYTWQIHHGQTCLNWTGRYYNTYHVNMNLLRSIKADGNIRSDYDQMDGSIPRTGTPNIDGILKVDYTWNVDNGSFKTFRTVPDFFQKSVCHRLNPSDGQTYTFKVKPIDVNSRYMIETLTIHIDRSPPGINNLYLTRDGVDFLFVHNSSDLAKMTLQFEAIDIHSGIQTVQWSLGTTDGGSELGSGAIGTNKINGSCVTDECYCPKIGSCEEYTYNVDLNKLVDKKTNIGQHNREYFFTVIVSNNAGLVNIEHLDVLADDSPPEVGVVQEGSTGTPDIDYTSESEVTINWHGFIDHESGIKFYKVALADYCLSPGDMDQTNETNHNYTSIIETEKNSQKFEITTDGFYVTSVIAYNNAMEPSDVVCSDGFRRDTTIPEINNVTLKNSKSMELVACDESGPWLIRSDLTRTLLNKTDTCINRCATSPSFDLLQHLPQVKDETPDADLAEYRCSTLRNATDDWFIYIPSNNIDISWVSQDNGSQIRSEDVGVASDATSTSSPDLEGYRETHGHSRYHNIHVGLDRGIPFYIMVKSTNKAGMEYTLALGPIIIDDTPPQYTSGLQVHIDQDNDKIFCHWRNDSFMDTEQRHAVDYVLYKIGSGEKFYTPMLQIPPGETCLRSDLSHCVHYPLHKLQRQDEETGLEFFFELYVYNMAEHFTTVRSDLFKLPSQYLPGNGLILDLDPSTAHQASMQNDVIGLRDTDAHYTVGMLCASWTGFYHHKNVTFQIGIGTKAQADDVNSFDAIEENTNTICLNSSGLIPWVKYFVTINATCSAGSVLVSSDGVTIVDENTFNNGFMNIKLGIPCDGAVQQPLLITDNDDNSSIVHSQLIANLKIGHPYVLESETDSDLIRLNSTDVLWLGGIRKKSGTYRREFRPVKEKVLFSTANQSLSWSDKMDVNVTLLDCSELANLTSASSSLQATVELAENVSKLVRSFKTSVFKDDCPSDVLNSSCLEQLIGSESMSPGGVIRLDNLSLENKQAYRLGVGACIGQRCLPFIYSERIIVQNKKPTTQRLSAVAEQRNGTCLDVTIEWDRFDCIQKEALTEIYEWSLALGEKSERPITQWTDIQANYAIRNVSVHDCLRLPVYLNRPIYACVRTMCESGVSGIVCTRLKTPHPNHYKERHVYELEQRNTDLETIKKNINSRYLGETLTRLHEGDIDFCMKNTTLVGVIPNSEERVISWYLLTYDYIPYIECEESHNCIKSETTQGGFVTFYKTRLIPGERYYICATSNQTTIQRELFTDVLEEFSVCGNGFLVDDTPPTAGQVRISNQRNGYMHDRSEISISWSGFEDTLTSSVTNFTSSLELYEYAIGTSPGGINVAAFETAGDLNFLMVSGLQLESGGRYYVTVRATDHVGLFVEATSPVVVADFTPPTNGAVTVGGSLKHRYMMAKKELSVHWEGFADQESGIEHYFIGIGDMPDADNVFAFEEVTEQFADLSRKTLQDGLTYYAILKVVNKAGLWTMSTSKAFTLDSSPPRKGVVRDDDRHNPGDIDFQNFTSSLSCHWEAFSDPDSGIHFYRVGLGTSPGAFDTVMLTGVGLRTEIMWKEQVIAGEKYYCTVEACNGAGLCTRHHSDGVIMDDSAPISGLVHVGLSSRHETYQNHRNSISANWVGFEDPHSDLHHFEWCITINTDTCDILPYTNILLSQSVFKTSLSLPLNTTIFVKLKAFNNVGMFTEAISDGFNVDDTHPVLVRRPEFVLEDMHVSHKPGTQWDNSLIRIRWKFRDPDSPIIKHVIRLRTHHDGKALKEITKIGNEDTVTIQMADTDRLMNGDRYWATVTACNAAGLCTNATSDDLLIDSTPPNLGGIKPPMTWENADNGSASIINLTWYGFSDIESGISKYFVTISTNYSGSDVSDGPKQFDTLPTSEQDCSIKSSDTISEGDEFVLSIWAVNNVGLRSDIGKITVSAMKTDTRGHKGILKLQKHSCDTHYCNNDCTCAVVGHKCKPPSVSVPCQDASNSSDQLYQSVQVVGGTLEDHQILTASSSCLTAHWTAEQNDTKKNVQRYEWCIGIGQPGDGIFDGPATKVWYDVDLQTNITYCVLNTQQLTHGESYNVFVKAWYSSQKSAVFSSPPITVDSSPPDIVRGSSVYMSTDKCLSSVNFITNSSTLWVCWQKVFKQRTSAILNYELMAGTSPSGDDLVAITNVGKNATARLDDLNLYPGTKYYFTIRVTNTVGLKTVSSSDALVLDVQPPFEGVMFNTDHHQNVHYQSSTSSIGFSWHGFGDHHSHILSYSAWVMNEQTGKVVHKQPDIGIETSVIFDNLKLKHEGIYRGSVQAYDAAGYASVIVNSPPLNIDSTPPQSFKCTNYTQPEVFSFSSLDSFDLSFNVNMTKDTFYQIDVFMAAERAIISPTFQLTYGHHSMMLTLKENADGTKVATFSFLSPYDGDIKFDITLQKEFTSTNVTVSVSECSAMTYDPVDSPIDVHQVGHSHLSVCSRILDPESGIRYIQVGVGTTAGGFQVIPLTSVSIDNHIVIEHTALHGTTLYVTALAHNNAGLWSVFEGNQIVVDHTPPIIGHTSVSLSMVEYEDDNKTQERNATISVLGEVKDLESGVKTCACSLDMTELTASLTPSPSSSTARISCVFSEVNVRHGSSLQPEIACVNNVELVSRARTRQVVASLSPPSTADVMLDILPLNKFSVDTGISFDKEETIQSNLTYLLPRWSGFYDVTGIRQYVFSVMKGNKTILVNTADDPRTMAALSGVSLLDGEIYSVSVEAVNAGGIHSDPVLASFRADSRVPKLSGTPVTLIRNNGGPTVLNWQDCFVPLADMSAIFEVNIGSRTGYTDVINRFETMETSVVLPETEESGVWVSVCAIYPTGMSNCFRGNVII